MFPLANHWHREVTSLPVHPDSNAYMADICSQEGDNTLRGEWGPGHTRIHAYTVTANQVTSTVDFGEYSAMANPGPYPLPEAAKLDLTATTGDRQVLIFQDRLCYELYGTTWTGTAWTAMGGRIFDTHTSDYWDVGGAPRPNTPAGNFSCSDSGLSNAAGLVTWEDLNQSNGLQHAVAASAWHQKGFVAPALRGTANPQNPAYTPPLGLRLRLKADYPLAGFQSTTARLLGGLKRYGIILTDASAYPGLALTGMPDPRWPSDRGFHFDQAALATIPLQTAFEVIA